MTLRPSLAALPWLLALGAQAADLPAPVLQHDSVLSRYKRFEDQGVGAWPQANQTVGRIGGWRSYARETAPPPAAPAAATEPATPPKDPHAGHGAHKDKP